MSRQVERCLNIAELRLAARRRLPRPLFDYIDGGAEDRVTLNDNVRDFAGYRLVPRILRDVTRPDVRRDILGSQASLPLLLAPTALSRMFHHLGEKAVARAAGLAGLPYTLSTLSSVSIEEIGSIPGPKWFQLYAYKDLELIKTLLKRARAAGFSAACITVDANIAGNREIDVRNGLTLPPRISPSLLWSGMRRPIWSWNFLRTKSISTANIGGERTLGREGGSLSLLKYLNDQLDESMDWDRIAEIKRFWDGPFLIKGVMHPEDVRRARDLGCAGVILSNHGGRQLDSAPSALAMLPEVREEVGDEFCVLVDGGVRRGTDVLKAVALGADAVMVGRPYLYGLGAAGEPGVRRALEIFRSEIVRDMQLMGVPDLTELGPHLLRP